jgi:acetyltransferase-like isoleucine patch superfamily enzyme
MIIINIYRKFFVKLEWSISKLRIIHLKIKYPNISIDEKTTVGKHCYILCDNTSSLNLKNVIISNNSRIEAKKGGEIDITNTFIGSNCVIVSINRISIEANCEIAEFSVIRDQDHCYNFSNNPIAKQGYNSSPIKIKENVWIGTKATILRGVTIEKNSVIAAHALVNKSFSKPSLIAGTPAKVIKSLTEKPS